VVVAQTISVLQPPEVLAVAVAVQQAKLARQELLVKVMLVVVVR
jgi:hypothetical protein